LIPFANVAELKALTVKQAVRTPVQFDFRGEVCNLLMSWFAGREFIGTRTDASVEDIAFRFVLACIQYRGLSVQVGKNVSAALAIFSHRGRISWWNSKVVAWRVEFRAGHLGEVIAISANIGLRQTCLMIHPSANPAKTVIDVLPEFIEDIGCKNSCKLQA
jgi:hypothetical protein